MMCIEHDVWGFQLQQYSENDMNALHETSSSSDEE